MLLFLLKKDKYFVLPVHIYVRLVFAMFDQNVSLLNYVPFWFTSQNKEVYMKIKWKNKNCCFSGDLRTEHMNNE